MDLVCSQLKIEGVEKKHTRTGNCMVSLRLRTDSDIAPRPITGVMGDPESGDGSQDAETLMSQDYEGCEGLDNQSSLSQNYAVDF